MQTCVYQQEEEVLTRSSRASVILASFFTKKFPASMLGILDPFCCRFVSQIKKKKKHTRRKGYGFTPPSAEEVQL